MDGSRSDAADHTVRRSSVPAGHRRREASEHAAQDTPTPAWGWRGGSARCAATGDVTTCVTHVRPRRLRTGTERRRRARRRGTAWRSGRSTERLAETWGRGSPSADVSRPRPPPLAPPGVPLPSPPRPRAGVPAGLRGPGGPPSPLNPRSRRGPGPRPPSRLLSLLARPRSCFRGCFPARGWGTAQVGACLARGCHTRAASRPAGRLLPRGALGAPPRASRQRPHLGLLSPGPCPPRLLRAHCLQRAAPAAHVRNPGLPCRSRPVVFSLNDAVAVPSGLLGDTGLFPDPGSQNWKPASGAPCGWAVGGACAWGWVPAALGGEATPTSAADRPPRASELAAPRHPGRRPRLPAQCPGRAAVGRGLCDLGRALARSGSSPFFVRCLMINSLISQIH